jgi:tetratricopeptide (TPR) repeat protein
MSDSMRRRPASSSSQDGTDPRAARPRPDLRRGHALERFVVLDPLGAGSMGAVVAAYDPILDRKVALKVLRPDATDGDLDERRARLLREAQAMARLSHPNVITVYEVGVVGDHVFVAMEFVDGGTLRDWMTATRRPWREVAAMFLQAARGLAAAHGAQLAHRDFKPDNVLVGRDGRARVTDFGLVGMGAAPAPGSREQELDVDRVDREPGALAAPDSLGDSLTTAGAVMGTPRYMAPEQHRGEVAGAAADQFAFCVALYEALYGEWPFAGDSYLELHANVVNGAVREPPRDSDVPARLRRTVLRGLRVAPSERFPSMEALIDELAHDPTTPRRVRVLVGVSICAVAASGTAMWQLRGGPSCADARGRLAGVWDGGRRAEVAAAFAATGRPHAAISADRVGDVLDDYSAQWAAMRDDACEATHRRGEQSAALLDLRMRCLDRRRAEVDALVRMFVDEADGEVVDRAIAAALTLAPVDGCADVDALAAAKPVEADPATRSRVDDLRALLDGAVVRAQTGKYEDALSRVRSVVAGARELDDPRLLAQALFQNADVLLLLDELEAAASTAYEASMVASRADDDVIAARAWSLLVGVVGVRQARVGEGHVLARTARAAIARAGDPPRLRALIARNEAALLHVEASYDAARALHLEAIALSERAAGPDHPEVGAGYANLARTLRAQGDVAGARGAVERALAIFERAYGPAHPHVATVRSHLAGVLIAEAKPAEARREYARALAIAERALGPSTEVVRARAGIGDAHFHEHRYEQAVDDYRAAIAVADQIGDRTVVLMPLSNIGRALAALGRIEEAIPYQERTL